MATRMIGVDDVNPRLPAVVVTATQGTTSADLAPGDVLARYPSIGTVAATTYTVALGDAGRLVQFTSATAVTVTVPPNSTAAFPVGARIDLLAAGAGRVTVAAGAGVTINATPGLSLRTQWSSATLVKRATDVWVLIGDLL